jgi:hypothetical protein
MRLLQWFVCLALAPLLLACGDSPTVRPDTTSYELVSLDGWPIPAAYDSFFTHDSNRFLRVVGGSLELLSADSVRHSHAWDVIEIKPSGETVTWTSECTMQHARYRRSGNNLIVSLLVGNVMDGVVRDDTFTVSGTAASHRLRENPSVFHPEGRSWQLTYQETASVQSVCD